MRRTFALISVVLLLAGCAGAASQSRLPTGGGVGGGVPRCDRNGDLDQRRACE